STTAGQPPLRRPDDRAARRPSRADRVGMQLLRASMRAKAAVTGLPELDIARLQRWCANRMPEQACHQVRVECEVATRHLTIVERRAPWRADLGPEWTRVPIARLRYAKATRTWTLYWR